MSTKKFHVVFIAGSGRVTKAVETSTGTKAVAAAIARIDSEDLEVLGIDSEGRPIDAKHWPLDDAGFPSKAAQTEGLVLRTVTTVERVTAT